MNSIDQRSRDLHTPTPDLTFDEVETSPDLEETFDIMDLLAMDTTFGGDESITLEVEQSENLGDLTPDQNLDYTTLDSTPAFQSFQGYQIPNIFQNQFMYTEDAQNAVSAPWDFPIENIVRQQQQQQFPDGRYHSLESYIMDEINSQQNGNYNQMSNRLYTMPNHQQQQHFNFPQMKQEVHNNNVFQFVNINNGGAVNQYQQQIKQENFLGFANVYPQYQPVDQTGFRRFVTSPRSSPDSTSSDSSENRNSVKRNRTSIKSDQVKLKHNLKLVKLKHNLKLVKQKHNLKLVKLKHNLKLAKLKHNLIN
jgi:hypothetical protein